MEGGHVALLLPRHEEEGVGELGKLGQVVQPHHRGHPHPGAVRGGVPPLHVLANCGRTIKYQSLSLTYFFAKKRILTPVVVPEPAVDSGLPSDVSRQNYLED